MIICFGKYIWVLNSVELKQINSFINVFEILERKRKRIWENRKTIKNKGEKIIMMIMMF